VEAFLTTLGRVGLGVFEISLNNPDISIVFVCLFLKRKEMSGIPWANNALSCVFHHLFDARQSAYSLLPRFHKLQNCRLDHADILRCCIFFRRSRKSVIFSV